MERYIYQSVKEKYSALKTLILMHATKRVDLEHISIEPVKLWKITYLGMLYRQNIDKKQSHGRREKISYYRDEIRRGGNTSGN